MVARLEVQNRRFTDMLDHQEVLLTAGWCAFDDVRQRQMRRRQFLIGGVFGGFCGLDAGRHLLAALQQRRTIGGCRLADGASEGLLLGPQRVPGGDRGPAFDVQAAVTGQPPPGPPPWLAGRL